MPTTRRRHTITETEPVQEVLDELRAALDGEPIDFPDLLIRGARSKLSDVRYEDDRRDAALRRLADRIRNRDLPEIDLEAAAEVKRTWTRHVLD